MCKVGGKTNGFDRVMNTGAAFKHKVQLIGLET